MTNYPPGSGDPQGQPGQQGQQGQPGQQPQYPQYPQGQQYPQGGYPQYPQGGGYPPYGAGGGMPAPVTPPPSIQNAVKLMYAGAALGIIGLILSVTTISSVRQSVQNADTTLSTSQVNAIVNSAIAIAIVSGLIGAGLWIWMAQMNKRGRSWARILSTVFFGLFTLLFLLGLTRTGFSISLIVSIVEWLVALGATILIWQRASTAYYNAPKP